jgi:hypothetical protein
VPVPAKSSRWLARSGSTAPPEGSGLPTKNAVPVELPRAGVEPYSQRYSLCEGELTRALTVATPSAPREAEES